MAKLERIAVLVPCLNEAPTGGQPRERLPSGVAVALELAGMLWIAVRLVLSAVNRCFQEIEIKLDMLGDPVPDDS